MLWGGFEYVEHRIANFHCEIELGTGEAFGRVLEYPFSVRPCRRQFAGQPCRVHRDVANTGTVQSEYHSPLYGRGGVVNMHDSASRTLQRLERALNQRFAALSE